MTNFERIKEMSVEELAYFLQGYEPKDHCTFKNCNLCLCDAGLCREFIVDWLNKDEFTP